MKLTPLPLVPFALLAAASTAGAQTGPWADGEILIRAHVQKTGQHALFRIDPESGATAVLIHPQYWAGFSGAMVFDAHRGGVLANMSLPPDGTFFYRLWLVAHDGSAAAMPGITGNVRALASAGDGRVFFIRHTGATQGPQTVEYFDANDQIQTLKQSDGVTPFQLDAEHLLYHAPSNALIGAASWSATHCGPTGPSVYRVPLSADGLRVEGATTCATVPTSLLAFGEVMSLDHLPNGNVLASTATGWLGAPHHLIELDPLTLATSSWAQPQQHDVNGGVWSDRLGRAILHANSGAAWWEPEGLRTFAPGQNTFGGWIPTSATIPVGGGFGPAEILAEVDTNGPACDGIQVPYGVGLAGAGAFVPLLGAIGCPDVGHPFSLSVNGVVGGAPGLLAVSLSGGALPLLGGTLWVGPFALLLPIGVGGPLGVPGAGSLAVPLLLADPALAGIDLHFQAGFLDAAAVEGFSMTNGLRIRAG